MCMRCDLGEINGESGKGQSSKLKVKAESRKWKGESSKLNEVVLSGKEKQKNGE